MTLISYLIFFLLSESYSASPSANTYSCKYQSDCPNGLRCCDDGECCTYIKQLFTNPMTRACIVSLMFLIAIGIAFVWCFCTHNHIPMQRNVEAEDQIIQVVENENPHIVVMNPDMNSLETGESDQS